MDTVGFLMGELNMSITEIENSTLTRFRFLFKVCERYLQNQTKTK